MSSLLSRVCMLTAAGVLMAGCRGPEMVGQIQVKPPGERAQVSHDEYRPQPPDLLVVEMEAIPSDEQQIRAGDIVQVSLIQQIPDAPLDGAFLVRDDGMIDMGFYGTVHVGGLTVAQARETIIKHLTSDEEDKPGLQEADIIFGIIGVRPIAGQFLVRPDGTINLGYYGDIHVAGQSLTEIEQAIKNHLAQRFDLQNTNVNVDVLSYNTMVYYIVVDGAGFGENVVRLPITGHETVLDAVSQIGGLPFSASKSNVWISRPVPGCPDQADILPVDWTAIAKYGQLSTNYQIMPGDRIYLKSDNLYAANLKLSKILGPIYQILGGITLFDITVDALAQRNDFGNNNN